ncbi:MAG: SAM-dependent chlorinase/fluorinase [candidate division NC10 bacterium]|nr:SAM-dependent chlorinase/fluorinase [candidate division NC10 bacterium]
MRIITLLTDFGSADPFVGMMKGVILGIAPRVHVVDLCHEVSPQEVLEAAFLLHCAYRYFPTGTIHVTVIDPGVGGRRKPLAAEGRHGCYVAPDNGVLSYLFASGEIQRVVEISEAKYFLRPVSRTFHGRDIFAPVAAYLARGGGIERFGPVTTRYVRLTVPVPHKRGAGVLEGAVLHVDRFGNLMTNVSAGEVGKLGSRQGITVTIKDRTIRGLQQSYDRLQSGAVGAILGSAGYLEVFANQESAARLLGVGRGASVRVEAGKRRSRR